MTRFIDGKTNGKQNARAISRAFADCLLFRSDFMTPPHHKPVVFLFLCRFTR